MGNGKRPKRKVRTLYRPVGMAEAVLILETDAARFPPRLPEQPIFYPVLTQEYAEQITRNWNAPSATAGYAGFVTEFKVEAQYAERFQEHVVGRSAIDRELWVPSEELEQFNQHLVGPIAFISAHYGEGYIGPTPQPTMLKGCTAQQQLPVLRRILATNKMDFSGEVQTQRLLVQLNFAYWVRTDFTEDDLSLAEKIETLQEVQFVWNGSETTSELMLIGCDELEEHAKEVQG